MERSWLLSSLFILLYFLSSSNAVLIDSPLDRQLSAESWGLSDLNIPPRDRGRSHDEFNEHTSTLHSLTPDSDLRSSGTPRGGAAAPDRDSEFARHPAAVSIIDGHAASRDPRPPRSLQTHELEFNRHRAEPRSRITELSLVTLAPPARRPQQFPAFANSQPPESRRQPQSAKHLAKFVPSPATRVTVESGWRAAGQTNIGPSSRHPVVRALWTQGGGDRAGVSEAGRQQGQSDMIVRKRRALDHGQHPGSSHTPKTPGGQELGRLEEVRRGSHGGRTEPKAKRARGSSAAAVPGIWQPRGDQARPLPDHRVDYTQGDDRSRTAIVSSSAGHALPSMSQQELLQLAHPVLEHLAGVPATHGRVPASAGHGGGYKMNSHASAGPAGFLIPTHNHGRDAAAPVRERSNDGRTRHAPAVAPAAPHQVAQDTRRAQQADPSELRWAGKGASTQRTREGPNQQSQGGHR